MNTPFDQDPEPTEAALTTASANRSLAGQTPAGRAPAGQTPAGQSLLGRAPAGRPFGARSPVTRRRFLTMSALGATAAATPFAWSAFDTGIAGGAAHRTPLTNPVRLHGSAKSGPTLLVVIELMGGHDGFTSIAPTEDRGYQRLRSATKIDKPVAAHDGHGWHPSLAKLAKSGLAAGVLGIGVEHPDLSHFEMMQRWWMAAPDGATQVPYGFLGRLCDAITDRNATAPGITIGGGPVPALTAQHAATLSIDSYTDNVLPTPNDNEIAAKAWFDAMATYATNTATPQLAAAAQGIEHGVRFARTIGEMKASTLEYPGGNLGAQLKMASRLLSADAGVRVVHVPYSGFDTHTGHNGGHAALLTNFDDAVTTLLHDIDQRGLRERVVVATTSEFGRRAADNGSDGLDHGTASNLMVMGAPVRAGWHGAPVHWDRLDDNGNLRATTSMVDYYATLAAWLGVDPSRVLPGRPRGIDSLLK